MEHYRCAKELFWLSILPHEFYVIIDCGVSVTVYIREVFYGLKDTDKRFLLQLLATVQLSGTKGYEKNDNEL